MTGDVSKSSWSRTLTGSVSSLIVWSVHFAVVYALAGLGCEMGWQHRSLLGGNLVSILLLAVTVPALGLIAWIGWGGWRWQGRARQSGIEPDTARRWRFMGYLTVALACVAFVSTVMTVLPVVMLPPCEAN